MRIRPLLLLTAILSSLFGAVVMYFVLSVPNDLRADAMLKEARKQITAGDNDKARESLAKIVQQYPRTDAAAAATVALVSLGHQERKDLERAVIMLTRRNEQQTKLISDLQKSVTELRNAPPKIVTVTAPPPPKPAPKKKAPVRRRRR